MASKFSWRNWWATLPKEEKAFGVVLYVFALVLVFIGFSLWVTVAFAPPRYTRYFCFPSSTDKHVADSLFQPMELDALVRETVHVPYVKGSRVAEAFFLRLHRLPNTVMTLGGSVNRSFDLSDEADMRIYVPLEIYNLTAVGDTFRKVAGDYTYLLLSKGGDSLLAEPRFHYDCHCRQRNYSHDRKDGKLCCWGTP